MNLKRPSHDELVKFLMADKNVATDFFKAHVPASILEQVNLATLTLETGSFVDETLAKHESDLVFKVVLNNEQDAFFFLLEHQSRPDPLLPFRIRYYTMQLLKRHITQHKQQPLPLPVVFPIVLFNGAEPYRYSHDFYALFGEHEALAKACWNEPAKLIDVGELSEDDIRAHQLAGLLELSLCRAYIRKIEEEMVLLREIYEKYHHKVDGQIFTAVLKYDIYKWDQAEYDTKSYLAQAKELLPPELEKQTMTFAEAFTQKGIQKGRQEAYNQTRHAIELLEKNTSIDKIIELTGLDKDMILFLKQHLHH